MTTRNFLASGIGYQPDYIGGIVYNRTGTTLTVGEVVMVDHLAADAGFGGNASAAAYVAQTFGNELHPMAQVLVPTVVGDGALNGATPGAYMGIVDDVMSGAGADDTQVHVCWKGIVYGRMASTVGAGEYGKPVYGAGAVKTLTATFLLGGKPLGRLLQNTTTAATNALLLWNGIEGVGQAEAAS
jgi:hypothetical protein